jgi:hypothetical protein
MTEIILKIAPLLFLALTYFYVYAAFILWKVIKERRLLSETPIPIFPEARVIEKKVSPKLNDQKFIIVCETSRFIKDEDNPLKIYESRVQFSSLVKKKEHINDFFVNGKVLLTVKKIYQSETENKFVYHYSINPHNQHEDFLKFWHEFNLWRYRF